MHKIFCIVQDLNISIDHENYARTVKYRKLTMLLQFLYCFQSILITFRQKISQYYLIFLTRLKYVYSNTFQWIVSNPYGTWIMDFNMVYN